MSRTSTALPPSSTRSDKGALIVTIVSAHDLPFQDETPLAVSLQIARILVGNTGPPISRYASTNSFRFHQKLTVNSPLSILYKSKAVLTVEYPSHSLTTILECKQVCIQEPTSLTLKLKPKIPPEVTRNSITTSISQDSAVDPPTLKLQVCLEGPLRREVAALAHLTKAWFQVVDTVVDAIAPHVPSAKYASLLLLPLVPVFTGVLVVSPILIGISIVCFPIVLPLAILTAILVLGWTSIGAFVLASTRTGRSQIASTLGPLYQTLLKQPAAQIMVYDTGTRPTPVTLLQAYLPTSLMSKLWTSLLMDALGSSSYIIPGIGESFDVVWCPCQTLLIKSMYGTTSPNLMYVSFAEEFLPFTDVLPSATIGWLTEFGPELVEMVREHIGTLQKSWNDSSCDMSGVVCKTSGSSLRAPLQ